MKKKKLITGIVAGVIGLALVGTIAYLYVNLDSQRKENKAMQELADLDKKEMENEYQQFANQYREMKHNSQPSRRRPNDCSRNCGTPSRATHAR